MKHALFAALLLLASPALAQVPAGDAETLAQAPVYQSVPAHQAVADTAAVGADAELLSTVVPQVLPSQQVVAVGLTGDDVELISILAIPGPGNISVH